MPSNGTFTARVFQSRAQIPVEGATVTLSQRDQAGSRLIATRITDSSGNTAPVTLETPDASQSQAPGATQPWIQFDVAVDHRNFERVLIENVQVFPGIQTQQQVELIPYEEGPDAWNLTEIFDISAQPL